jgi:hypothetical protein
MAIFLSVRHASSFHLSYYRQNALACVRDTSDCGSPMAAPSAGSAVALNNRAAGLARLAEASGDRRGRLA